MRTRQRLARLLLDPNWRRRMRRLLDRLDDFDIDEPADPPDPPDDPDDPDVPDPPTTEKRWTVTPIPGVGVGASGHGAAMIARTESGSYVINVRDTAGLVSEANRLLHWDVDRSLVSWNVAGSNYSRGGQATAVSVIDGKLYWGMYSAGDVVCSDGIKYGPCAGLYAVNGQNPNVRLRSIWQDNDRLYAAGQLNPSQTVTLPQLPRRSVFVSWPIRGGEPERHDKYGGGHPEEAIVGVDRVSGLGALCGATWKHIGSEKNYKHLSTYGFTDPDHHFSHAVIVDGKIYATVQTLQPGSGNGQGYGRWGGGDLLVVDAETLEIVNKFKYAEEWPAPEINPFGVMGGKVYGLLKTGLIQESAPWPMFSTRAPHPLTTFCALPDGGFAAVAIVDGEYLLCEYK